MYILWGGGGSGLKMYMGIENLHLYISNEKRLIAYLIIINLQSWRMLVSDCVDREEKCSQTLAGQRPGLGAGQPSGGLEGCEVTP